MSQCFKDCSVFIFVVKQSYLGLLNHKDEGIMTLTACPVTQHHKPKDFNLQQRYYKLQSHII